MEALAELTDHTLTGRTATRKSTDCVGSEFDGSEVRFQFVDVVVVCVDEIRELRGVLADVGCRRGFVLREEIEPVAPADPEVRRPVSVPFEFPARTADSAGEGPVVAALVTLEFPRDLVTDFADAAEDTVAFGHDAIGCCDFRELCRHVVKHAVERRDVVVESLDEGVVVGERGR
ncbi:unknown [Haloarcula marismortui ATCC 43049]|uniref:Uncharacterized protein n=1 Tax=Haloarcula marismortui (strain ATCC 43049 / DSM 3752 / JCM 8966 / VKM B-1809) TaxID=272569 RepID=Q5V5I2_HALMA|nr:unknown [Haloarcula marismortui ATCC 43049]